VVGRVTNPLLIMITTAGVPQWSRPTVGRMR